MISISRAFSRSFFRHCGVCLAFVTLLATFVTAESRSALAEQRDATPVVGSFGIGGSTTSGINESDGALGLSIPLLTLPGLGTPVDLGISYRQDLAARENNVAHVGAGWTWAIPHVEISSSGSVRLIPASGGSFDADASSVSGLARYTLGDLKFRIESGTIPGRSEPGTDLTRTRSYAYSLEYAGGKDFFTSEGDMMSRFDAHGNRTDYVWANLHELSGVIDSAGNHARITRIDNVIEINGPERSDDQISRTTLRYDDGRLLSVTDTVGQTTTFGYTTNASTGTSSRLEHLLHTIETSTGAETTVTYQPVPGGGSAVDELVVRDKETGHDVTRRTWRSIGEHTSSGYPLYRDPAELARSGDPAYRYTTALSDGPTTVLSEYNALRLLVKREITVTTGSGTVRAQEQYVSYPGIDGTNRLDLATLPPQHTKPSEIVTVMTDADGNSRESTQKSEYDETGRLLRQTAPDGTVTETQYNTTTPGGTASVIPGGGLTLPVSFATEQTVTGADGTQEKTVHTPTTDGRSIASTDVFVGDATAGLTHTQTTEFTVDARGFATEKRVAAVGTTSSGEPREIVTRFGRHVDHAAKTITITRVDAAGTAAENASHTTYDIATALAISSTDATGRIATASYDASGRLVVATDELGRTTTTEYGNRVTRTTDSRGLTTRRYVDVTGRLVKTTDNVTERDGTPVVSPEIERIVERVQYSDNGAKQTVTDALGRSSTTTSDIFGRITEITGFGGITKRTRYDDVDNSTTETLYTAENDEPFRSTTTRNDVATRSQEITGTRSDGVPVPVGRSTNDGLGRLTWATGGDVTTRVERTPDGTPRTTITTPENSNDFPGEALTTTRNFDFRGVSTNKAVTSSSGEKKHGLTRILDEAGRTVSETDRHRVTTTYTYTVDGLIASESNVATGTTRSNHYDAVTRALVDTETTQTSPTGSTETSRTAFDYDTLTGELVAVFDPGDRKNSEIRYAYDALGNKTHTLYPDGKTIHNAFDMYGRAHTNTDIAGNVTNYVYDDRGLLARVTQSDPNGALLGAATYTYDSLGRTTSVTRDNGVTSTYAFNSNNDVTRETTRGNESELLFEGRYQYDSHDNLTEQTTQTAETGAAGNLLTESRHYRYNAYDQLIESTVYEGPSATDRPVKTTRYDIGATGDVIKTVAEEAGAVTTREFHNNELGQTATITINGVSLVQRYDAAGNLVAAADGTTIRYNVHNQPIEETRPDGSVTTTEYWPTGQRKRIRDQTEAANHESTTFYWDNTRIVNELLENENRPAASEERGRHVASYVTGNTRLARSVRSEETPGSADEIRHPDVLTNEYLVTDRHGSTIALANTRGVLTASYRYDDYGTITGTRDSSLTSNHFLFAGEYTTRDGKQKLSDRTYDPASMAFTTQDTADQFNRYSYGASNPITLVDPSGQTPDHDMIAAGLVLTVTLFAAVISATTITLPAANATFSAWAVWGIAAASTAADLGAVALSARHLIANSSDKDAVLTETAETLAYVAAGLGFAALVGMPAAALTRIQKGAAEAAAADGHTLLWVPRQFWSQEPAAMILTNELSGREAALAINAMAKRRATTGQLPEFLFVYKPGESAQIGFLGTSQRETLTKDYLRIGKIGAIDETKIRYSDGIAGGGSNHETLAYLMGAQFGKTLGSRIHISGGETTAVYRDQKGIYRMDVALSSGHFAADAPAIYWSPERRQALIDTMRQHDIEVTIHEHDGFDKSRIPLKRVIQARQTGLY